MKPALATTHGKINQCDSLEYMRGELPENSVDLIFTSPPFGLVRKKDYGNVDSRDYVAWFKPFAFEFFRILKPSGSFVIDIGGSWLPGQPTRSLYHFELLVSLCREIGFHLAQEFYWWNPAKLPTPAEWVTVRRIRVKDAVNSVFWLSKTPWPKASNRRVLAPYSESMKELLRNGYKPKLRPSGHDISDKFSANNGASIPPNLIAIPNTESNSYYLRYCKEKQLKPHPARFPSQLPEFFVRMLTDEQDLVYDPFAGSCVTGEVCEQLRRRWICCELMLDYVEGAKGRFTSAARHQQKARPAESYKLPSPASLWNDYDLLHEESPLDNGAKRQTGRTKTNRARTKNASLDSFQNAKPTRTPAG